MVELTVAICCHNPRPHYLRRVFDALRGQTCAQDRWELLLIDNASTVPLETIYDISWHPGGRHIRENELGLTPARRRGIYEASSELLIFVDDDNILDPNYLSEAITIGHNWPILGVWGSGAIIPEFEAPPAEYVKQLVSYLALRNTKVARWGNVLPCTDATPWGAGLCVRSKVADAYCKHNERAVVHISDRQGSTLLSGGDVEISYIANDIGLGMGIFPQLRLTHLIPKERVSLNYLLKIYEGTLISNLLLAYKWEDYEVVLASKPRRFLSRLKNLIFLRGIDRQIYLANRRAEVAAKTIISKSQTMPRGPKPNKADVMTEETL